VYANPLNRKYERIFTSLKDEFETITTALDDQQQVLIALQDSINKAKTCSLAYASSISGKMEPSRESFMVVHLLHQPA
jgi:type IV secretory pathway VirB4 component